MFPFVVRGVLVLTFITQISDVPDVAFDSLEADLGHKCVTALLGSICVSSGGGIPRRALGMLCNSGSPVFACHTTFFLTLPLAGDAGVALLLKRCYFHVRSVRGHICFTTVEAAVAGQSACRLFADSPPDH